jgi:hypothetical protein
MHMTKFSFKTSLPFFILLLVSMLPLLSLLTPGFPVTHDGQDHIARIANFYQSLSDGVIVPRWAANLNWGYGHPILMFLYPLPSYVGSFFHFLGFPFVDATKLVFAVMYIASIFTMYLFARESWGHRIGMIAALLYGFAPYRFIDLYVRGAIGEHAAFVFPPLVLYFLLKLARSMSTDAKKWNTNSMASHMPYMAAASISLAALILSHNAISLMFLPIIILYVIYLYVFEAKKSFLFLVSCFLCLSFGFGLSAFFWAPALVEGKYTLRDIVTAGSFDGRFVPVGWFLYSPWNYGQGTEFTKSLGPIQILGIVLIFFSAFMPHTEKKSVVLRMGLLAITLGALFLMTSASAIVWKYVTILQKFQFPWRILSVTTFTTAILGAMSLDWLVNKIPQKKGTHVQTILFCVSCFLCIVVTVNMWHPKAYSVKPESFFTGIYNSTTDTGESSPIWSIRFMEHRATAPMNIIDGTMIITPLSRTTVRHDYRLEGTRGSNVLENTLYFPGWNVYVDGSPVGVEYQNPTYRGLMTFYVPEGTHDVSIRFTETKFRKLSNAVSVATLGVLITIIVGARAFSKKRTS